jgi:hypothetical protein
MRCTISHHGGADGTADLTGAQGVLNGEFEPLHAYGAMRSVVDRMKPRQLLPDPDAPPESWLEILDDYTAFCNELKIAADSGQRLVTTELVLFPEMDGALWVEARIDEATAPVGARLPDTRRKGVARSPRSIRGNSVRPGLAWELTCTHKQRNRSEAR